MNYYVCYRILLKINVLNIFRILFLKYSKYLGNPEYYHRKVLEYLFEILLNSIFYSSLCKVTYAFF